MIVFATANDYQIILYTLGTLVMGTVLYLFAGRSGV
jgi:hypothetical protein